MDFVDTLGTKHFVLNGIIVICQLKYHSKTIEEKRNEEKETKKKPRRKKLFILRLQSMLVWISICKENHALRAWREITWYS